MDSGEPYAPHQSTQPPSKRKRTRPKVPSEQRQRAPVACSSCRRLKEKCDGNVPCQRCERYERVCTIASPAPRNGSAHDAHGSDACRIRHLETIALHFLGDIDLSEDGLIKAVAGLELDNSSRPRQIPVDDELARTADQEEAPALDDERFCVHNVTPNTAHYSGEFSHWNFSQRLRQQVEQQLQSSTGGESAKEFQVLDYWRAHHLKSRDFTMKKIMQSLPPKEVAVFLVDVYFRYAQTNTFFVEEKWTRERVEALYSPHLMLTADDACWLCTMLMVLAIGTQFAHMAQVPSHPGEDGIESVADAVGTSFYQMAGELIPDIIAIASVDSVQAFLLIAHYTLPLDAHGVAYTYLGLALRMAIQNGMHRKSHGNDLDPSMHEMRNRLWWSTYRLEKRVSVLHGRPTSISSSEVDAEYPLDFLPGIVMDPQSRKLENIMTKITDWLGDIAFIILMLRKCPVRLRHTYFERLLHVRSQYLDWWNSSEIPSLTEFHSRQVTHIHIAYHMNLVYLGRPFMLNENKTSPPPSSGKTNVTLHRAELAHEAVSSAQQIIRSCQQLQETTGLAKASYIEFNSCRAAVLVLLAKSLQGCSREVRNNLTHGMHLIRYMASGSQSNTSEASIMNSIEAAIRQLDARRGIDASLEVARTLSNFKKWASRFNDGEPRHVEETALVDPNTAPSKVDLDVHEAFDWSPFDAAIFDEASVDLEGLGMHHFDEAFSIAHGGHEYGSLQSRPH